MWRRFRAFLDGEEGIEALSLQQPFSSLVSACEVRPPTPTRHGVLDGNQGTYAAASLRQAALAETLLLRVPHCARAFMEGPSGGPSRPDTQQLFSPTPAEPPAGHQQPATSAGAQAGPAAPLWGPGPSLHVDPSVVPTILPPQYAQSFPVSSAETAGAAGPSQLPSAEAQPASAGWFTAASAQQQAMPTASASTSGQLAEWQRAGWWAQAPASGVGAAAAPMPAVFSSPVFPSLPGQPELQHTFGMGGMGAEEMGLGKAGGGISKKHSRKPRLVWTQELHARFINAVNHLGVKNAVPKTILQLMNVEGMTRENVASHLQKYRLYLKKLAGVPATAQLPADMLQQMQLQAPQAAQLQMAMQHVPPATLLQHGPHQLMTVQTELVPPAAHPRPQASATEQKLQPAVPQQVHVLNLPTGQTGTPGGSQMLMANPHVSGLPPWQGAVPMALPYGALQAGAMQAAAAAAATSQQQQQQQPTEQVPGGGPSLRYSAPSGQPGGGPEQGGYPAYQLYPMTLMQYPQELQHQALLPAAPQSASAALPAAQAPGGFQTLLSGSVGATHTHGTWLQAPPGAQGPAPPPTTPACGK